MWRSRGGVGSLCSFSLANRGDTRTQEGQRARFLYVCGHGRDHWLSHLSIPQRLASPRPSRVPDFAIGTRLQWGYCTLLPAYIAVHCECECARARTSHFAPVPTSPPPPPPPPPAASPRPSLSFLLGSCLIKTVPHEMSRLSSPAAATSPPGNLPPALPAPASIVRPPSAISSPRKRRPNASRLHTVCTRKRDLGHLSSGAEACSRAGQTRSRNR